MSRGKSIVFRVLAALLSAVFGWTLTVIKYDPNNLKVPIGMVVMALIFGIYAAIGEKTIDRVFKLFIPN